LHTAIPVISKVCVISFHLLSIPQRNPLGGLLVVALLMLIVEGGC
jgi:hypothetical protein